MSGYVLVGTTPVIGSKGRRPFPSAPKVPELDHKAFGPFDTTDEAADFCNTLGLGLGVTWSVVPLGHVHR